MDSYLTLGGLLPDELSRNVKIIVNVLVVSVHRTCLRKPRPPHPRPHPQVFHICAVAVYIYGVSAEVNKPARRALPKKE
jgi:hypothetical protein